MRVKVRTLGPLLTEALGQRELEVEFVGQTVDALIATLVREHGPRVRKALFDEAGRVDPTVQVLVNEETWVRADQVGETILEDGDTVTLLMLVAGG